MPRLYDEAFYDWVNLTAQRSAERVLPNVWTWVRPASVVDVGCGEGTWLAVWRSLGVADPHGYDGAYVNRARLQIPEACFTPADLTGTFAMGRRFDLAQSLETAEHLPPAVASSFVAQLCRLSDIVLFSAAQPGQGGENHINERLPSFWAGLFAAQGYAAYDALRPRLAADRSIAPWYRFNTILYANAAGAARLPPEVRTSRVAQMGDLDRAGDLGWRLRLRLLRGLPVGAVSALSRLRYRVACLMARAPTPLVKEAAGL